MHLLCQIDFILLSTDEPNKEVWIYLKGQSTTYPPWGRSNIKKNKKQKFKNKKKYLWSELILVTIKVISKMNAKD